MIEQLLYSLVERLVSVFLGGLVGLVVEFIFHPMEYLLDWLARCLPES